MKTLGIGIPCYDKHAKFLPDLLDSISQSTILPDQVCVSISSVSAVPVLKTYPFSLEVIVTSEFKNVSQNRNIAASKLKTDIISFIDSDDFSHIKRNEYILKAFDNPNCQVVVHNFYKTLNRADNFITEDIGELEFYPEYLDTFNPNVLPWPLNKHTKYITYTNGHVSLYRELFNKFKYKENWQGIGEDCDLNARLVVSGIKISYIKNQLSKYIN